MNARALPLAAAIVAALGAGPAVATVLPVTSCADDGSTGTLRAAALIAHDGDTIDLTQLTCSTITLENGPIDSSLLGPNPLYDLTIVGPGQEALTISGGGASAVFVAGGPNLGNTGAFTLENLTVAHGAKYNAAACVFAATGSVVLNDVTVTDCHATQSNHVQGGGAVGAFELTLTDSTISDSSVIAVGQGIATGGGAWAYTATVVRSTISGNRVSAPGAYAYWRYQTSGGGLYTRGPVTLIDSTISGNTVEATAAGQDANGGGVGTRGRLSISGSTFADNSADGAGGGLFTGLFRYPMNPQSPMPVLVAPPISDSTFTGNSANIGGAFATESNFGFANSTIASNYTTLGGALIVLHGGTANYDYALDLDSTIIAGNTSGANPSHAADLATDPRITLAVIGANNLIGAADPAITLPPDTLHDDPRLLPLAWNGGPTDTMALALDSPALDAGNNVAGLTTDQRGSGYVRVYGSAADIGAYELQPTPDVIFADGFD